MTAKPTPHESLFPETEPNRAPTSPKERLIETYALLLVEAPPVKSLTVEHCPDADQRMRLARRLAAKDVPRLLTAVSRCKLEIGDAGRMASAKELLTDWITWAGDSDGLDELAPRTTEFLQKGQRP
jgi:hypothetical protein